jgi:hypothetical protein
VDLLCLSLTLHKTGLHFANITEATIFTVHKIEVDVIAEVLSGPPRGEVVVVCGKEAVSYTHYLLPHRPHLWETRLRVLSGRPNRDIHSSHFSLHF